MKKIISYLVVMLVVLQTFVVPTKVLASEEIKTNIQAYAEELDSISSDVLLQVKKFNEWSRNYAYTLKSIMTKDMSSSIMQAVSNDNYNLAFSLIESGLNSTGNINAANELSILKPNFVNAIDKTRAYEIKLNEFLGNNKNTILVADMLPLIDSARSNYSIISTQVKSILDIYYSAYYNDATTKLNQYKDMSISKLDSLFDELEKEIYIYEDYLNTLNGKLESWRQLFYDLNLAGMGFEDLLYDDIRPYVTKIENLFIDTYNSFTEKQWIELRSEGISIVNDTSKTIVERNQILLDKISYYNSLKEKARSNFQKLKSKTSINKILTRINRLETKALDECDKAIEYVRSLLLIEEFDLVLNDWVTSDQVILNRESKYLITNNEYDLDTFMSFLKVKNEAEGEIKANNVYNTMVGTKSEIGVYQGEEEKVLYHVILKGDVRANGIIDVSDVTYLIKTVLNRDVLDEIENIAGDMNDDSKLDISDITAVIKKALS